MRRLFFAGILPVVFFLFCNRNPAPMAPSPAQNTLSAATGQAVYILDSGQVEVKFVISNTTSDTAYFNDCCNALAFVVEKKINNQWTEYMGWGYPCLALCLSMPVRIIPSSSHTDQVILDEVGYYRLLFLYDWRPDPLATDSLYSNAFLVAGRK